jgi:predicted lipid-binding transport protein (Tim44 family)
MGNDASVIDIIIFAAIAIFLLFRLRAVLGRRTGEEQERSNPFDHPSPAPFSPNLAEPRAGSAPNAPATIEHDPTLPLSLDGKLARVHAADPSFDEKHFLSGARNAFQIIVQAFSAGDLATLRPLLSSHLYGEFGRGISSRANRETAGQVTFEGPIEAEIIDARVIDGEIQIQIRFASRQIHPGDTEIPDEAAIDLWTFARSTGSRDPNWQLVETAIGS